MTRWYILLKGLRSPTKWSHQELRARYRFTEECVRDNEREYKRKMQ